MTHDWHNRYSTPDAIFDPLHAALDFAVDLAADPETTKLPDWLGPGGLAPDALTIPWAELSPGRWLFLNPPFLSGVLARFVETCAGEAAVGARICAVLPAHRNEQAWWHDNIIGRASEVLNVRGRVAYELRGTALEAWRAEEIARAAKNGRKPKDRPDAPNFPSCVVMWNGMCGLGKPTIVTSWDPFGKAVDT